MPLPLFLSFSFTYTFKSNNTHVHKIPETTDLNVLFKASLIAGLLLNERQLLMGSAFEQPSFPPSRSWGEGLNNQHSLCNSSVISPPFSPFLGLIPFPSLSFLLGLWLRFLPLCLIVPLILSFYPLFPEAPENTSFFPPLFTSLPSLLASPRWERGPH